MKFVFCSAVVFSSRNTFLEGILEQTTLFLTRIVCLIVNSGKVILVTSKRNYPHNHELRKDAAVVSGAE
jgi:hypothetical protein